MCVAYVWKICTQENREFNTPEFPESKTRKRVHLTMVKPTLTLGRPRVNVKKPSCADAANYYDDFTHGYKNLSSSISLLWLESDLTMVKMS